MKVDITSLFVNSYIQGATATASWGTSIGQKKTTECRIEVGKDGVQDVVNGMVYKCVSQRSLFDLSRMSENREALLVSKFDKIYINGQYQEGLSFVLLLCREQTQSHFGRLMISYPPYVSYNGIKVNKFTMDRIGEVLGCAPIGCWFVSEINVENQDEIHIRAHSVDKQKPAVYNVTSRERSVIWMKIVEKDNSMV